MSSDQRDDKETTMELQHLQALLAQVKGCEPELRSPAGFPGFDAYVPTYVSSGTTLEDQRYGQLERDTKRDKH